MQTGRRAWERGVLQRRQGQRPGRAPCPRQNAPAEFVPPPPSREAGWGSLPVWILWAFSRWAFAPHPQLCRSSAPVNWGSVSLSLSLLTALLPLSSGFCLAMLTPPPLCEFRDISWSPPPSQNNTEETVPLPRPPSSGAAGTLCQSQIIAGVPL